MGFVIDPERWYDELELRQAGWFSEDQLRRGRKKEGLRCRVIDRTKRIYKGAWLEEWLERMANGAEAETGAGA